MKYRYHEIVDIIYFVMQGDHINPDFSEYNFTGKDKEIFDFEYYKARTIVGDETIDHVEHYDFDRAEQNIMNEYDIQWLTEKSITCWKGIQQILQSYRSGKLTAKQIKHWSSRVYMPVTAKNKKMLERVE